MQNNVHMRPFLCKNETENIFWEYHDKCLMSPIWIFPDVYRCLTVSQCIVTFPLLPHSSYLLLGLLLKQFSIKENCVLTLLNVGESMKFVTYFTNGQTKKCCWEVFYGDLSLFPPWELFIGIYWSHVFANICTHPAVSNIHLESCFWPSGMFQHCSFGSLFGLHQILTEISASLAAKCSTMFTSLLLLFVSICHLVLSWRCTMLVYSGFFRAYSLKTALMKAMNVTQNSEFVDWETKTVSWNWWEVFFDRNSAHK